VLPRFREELTWIPGNRKKISIWNNYVLRNPPLASEPDLLNIRAWMQEQGLVSLWDISTWSVDESWLNWQIPNYLRPLEEENSRLLSSLQGYVPIAATAKEGEVGAQNLAYTPQPRVIPSTLKFQTFPLILLFGNASGHFKSLPKIDIFVWTLAHGSILSGENLEKKGFVGLHRCPLCRSHKDTSEHLFLDFSFAKEAWALALGPWSRKITLSGSLASLQFLGSGVSLLPVSKA
jgi:hypothetical protein